MSEVHPNRSSSDINTPDLVTDHVFLLTHLLNNLITYLKDTGVSTNHFSLTE